MFAIIRLETNGVMELLTVLVSPGALDMTEEQCIAALKEARWPDGYRCPRCASTACREITGRRLPLYECASCRYQCSLIAGTVMERSRVSLRKWFAAIELIACRPVTAVDLSAILQVTYKTAWLMLHKLRDAMARHNEQDYLTGIVRLNVGISGRKQIRMFSGLHPGEKPFVIGGVMSGDKNSTVRKIMLMQDSGGDTYHYKILPQGAQAFIERYVDLNTATVNLDRMLDPGPINPFPLRAITWEIDWYINRTHCGIGRKHLQAYLHEYAYRYNRANEHIRHDGSPYAAAKLRMMPEDDHRGLVSLQLLRLAATSSAPMRRAITSRPTPGIADWASYVNLQRMERAYDAYTATLRRSA